MWTPDSTWLSRLRLLDDLPLSGRGADLFELEPHVRLLAEAISNCEGPLVVHVDGTWGRGKTSFCRLVEEELTREDRREDRRDEGGWVPASCSRYVASDDRGAAASSLLYAIAKAVAGADDPEEAARIVRQWGADEALSAMRVDGFATWLSHELGRSTWVPTQEEIEIPLGARPGSVMALSLRRNPRRAAVVFVDDLDRCPGERVVEVLDAIRSYVACPGLVFVIAADRRLIARAFEQIVAREADLGHVDASEAMEKYIHRRVELPSFRGFRGAGLAKRLRALQCRLIDAREPYLLSIPTAEFEDGVAWQLARRFGASLTPRRLKRVLNDLAIDMAGFVDDAGLAEAFEDEARWRELWAATAALEPSFTRGGGKPSADDLRGYFVGRVLVRVAEHMWPSLVSRLEPGDDEFVRRSQRLLALAGTHGQWKTEAAKRMRDELLAGLDPVATTALHQRRQLCEFMAVVLEAAHEASRWQRAPQEQALEEQALGFAFEAAESDEQEYVETLQQQAIEPSRALVSLGDETYLRAKSVPMSASLSALDDESARSHAEVDDDLDDDEGSFEDLDEAADGPASRAELAGRPIELEAELLGRLIELEQHGGVMVEAEREKLLADALFKLEVLLATANEDAELMELSERLLNLDPTWFQDQHRSLWAVAQLAASRGFERVADAVYAKLVTWVETLGGLGVGEQLKLFVDYLELLIERQPHGEDSLGLADNFIRFWHRRDTSELDLFDLWRNAATLRSLRPERDFGWSEALNAFVERAGVAYRDDAGRENARRYVLLLRAVGGDDPKLDELFGPRATLIDPERGEPSIIEALADILVRRRRPEDYARARALYLRLRGTPRWTPELLHNLATAENALDGADESAGAHWLEAYRRDPANTVIRRSLRRFLIRRKFVDEAQRVSRGEPLPGDFAPFQDRTLTQANEETPT